MLARQCRVAGLRGRLPQLACRDAASTLHAETGAGWPSVSTWPGREIAVGDHGVARRLTVSQPRMFWRRRAVYSVCLRTSARAFCGSACGLPLTWSGVRVICPLQRTGAGPGSSCCWPLACCSTVQGEASDLRIEARAMDVEVAPASQFFSFLRSSILICKMCWRIVLRVWALRSWTCGTKVGNQRNTPRPGVVHRNSDTDRPAPVLPQSKLYGRIPETVPRHRGQTDTAEVLRLVLDSSL